MDDWSRFRLVAVCLSFHPITLLDILRAMAPPFLKSQEEYKKLVDSVDTFLLDCDGVLYHGKQVVEGVRTVLDMLRKKGKAGRFEISAHW